MPMWKEACRELRQLLSNNELTTQQQLQRGTAPSHHCLDPPLLQANPCSWFFKIPVGEQKSLSLLDSTEQHQLYWSNTDCTTPHPNLVPALAATPGVPSFTKVICHVTQLPCGYCRPACFGSKQIVAQVLVKYWYAEGEICLIAGNRWKFKAAEMVQSVRQNGLSAKCHKNPQYNRQGKSQILLTTKNRALDLLSIHKAHCWVDCLFSNLEKLWKNKFCKITDLIQILRPLSR